MSRAEYIKACIELMGLPYLWDGKGFPSEPYNGRDCSGFVTERLHSIGGPDLRSTWNTAKMWAELPHLEAERVLPGDLAMWSDANGAPDHVMVRVGVDLLLIGAAGGDHTTTTKEAALARGARVQVWLTPPDRRGFELMGYLRLPWLDAGVTVS